MKEVSSVVVAFDGESKCGKTTIINAVAGEAAYQASVIPSVLASSLGQEIDAKHHTQLNTLHHSLSFNKITAISAGNGFRAAALLVIKSDKTKHAKTEFVADDIHRIRDLLRVDGIGDMLQNDPKVGQRVSEVARMAGVQALCGALFCDAIENAYNAGSGSNLVIVDARDPVGCMQRNGLLGVENGKVKPRSILPVYIDTPPEVAAMRMPGDFDSVLAEICQRRQHDASRSELPVVRPTVIIEDFGCWARQFNKSGNDVAVPYLLNNGERVELSNIQYFAGKIAAIAQDVAWQVHQESMAT